MSGGAAGGGQVSGNVGSETASDISLTVQSSEAGESSSDTR